MIFSRFIYLYDPTLPSELRRCHTTPVNSYDSAATRVKSQDARNIKREIWYKSCYSTEDAHSITCKRN